MRVSLRETTSYLSLLVELVYKLSIAWVVLNI